MKKNNIFFIVLISLILILGLYTLVREQKVFSSAENRNFTLFPHLTYKSFFNGDYQTNLENALSDQFVGSETIRINYNNLLDVSSFLDVKDKICKGDYYNIGSSRYIYDCDDYLVFKPNYLSEETKNIILKNIESFSKLNEKIDTYYYFVNTSVVYDFKTNSNSIDVPSFIKDNMTGEYKLDYLKINNYEDFKNYFYKNDHHWNYKGSYQGYKDIISMIAPKDKIKKPVEEVRFDDISFFGSQARIARFFDFEDIVSVYKFDLAKHETYVDGEEKSYGDKDCFFEHKYETDDYINFYAEFYGDDYGEIIFNFNKPKKDNLLIISNSFSNAVNELIASHFNKTYVLDGRHYYNYTKEVIDLMEYIKKNDIDKVLYIMDYSFLENEVARMGLEE